MIDKISCPLKNKCGNCQLLNLKYQDTLSYKLDYVNSLFKKAKITTTINEIIPANHNTKYRNKMIIGFKKINGKIISGFYEENSHKIVDLDNCILHSEEQNNIATGLKKIIEKLRLLPYDEDRKIGLIRYALIKEAINTNEILITIVTASENFPARNDFVKMVRNLSPKIKTIIQNINSRKTSIVLGEKERVLYGPGFINETLLGLKFQITSKSFFQVNPLQTVKLYQTVEQFASFSKDDVIIDAYSGIGTIGLYLSKHVKQVISVENNKQAVSAAIKNAKNNNINNVSFFCDDATNFIVEFAKEKPLIDVLIMDPPRTGSTVQFLDSVCKLKPKQVIYVSCGPDTLVRDLPQLLKNGYQIKNIKCVDMFCWTNHVETVVCLMRK